MLNYKILILPFLGLLSGILVGLIYNSRGFIFSTIPLSPGFIFSIFIAIGIYFNYHSTRNILKYLLFLILSTLGYFSSFWIVVFISNLISAPLAFFVAGLIGGFLMLLGLKLLLPIKKESLIYLSILAGILGIISVLINYFIIQGGGYHGDMMSYGNKYVRAMQESGMFLLHILWNGTMAIAIALSNYNKLK